MVIGVTGGVGSGKTTVLNEIKKIKPNCKLLLTDDIAKSQHEIGSPIYNKIVELFSKDILNKDKTINKNKLSNIIFNDKEKLFELNKIIHPFVEDYVKNYIEENKDSLIILESAILIESNLAKYCDNIIYVYVPKEIRMERLKLNRNYSNEKILNIMSNQKDDDFFFKHCDIIIHNVNLENMKMELLSKLEKLC